MKTLITKVLFLCILTAIASITNAANQSLTLEDIIFSETKFKNFTLSPSGSRVFFKGKDGEIYKGIVYDIHENKVVHIFNIPDDLDNTKIFWLNEDELVLGAVGNIYKISLTKRSTRPLFKKNFIWDREFRELDANRWYIKAVSPNDTGNLILSMVWRYGDKYFSTLFEYDAKNYTTKRLTDDQLGVSYWIVTKKGKISIAVKKLKGTKSYFVLRNGELKPVLTPEGTPLIENRFDESKNRYFFQGISEESDNVYLTENRIDNTSRIIEINPDSGILISIIEEVKNVDLGVKNCNFLFHRHPVTGHISGYSYYDKKLVTKWIDKQFSAIQNNVNVHLPESDNRIIECNKSLKFCLITSSSKGMPSTYLYDTEKNIAQLVAAEYPELSKDNIYGQKLIQIKRSDNTSITNYFTASTIKNKNNQRKVIIIPCGYLDYPYNGKFYDFENYFSLRGFDVINISSIGCRGNGNNKTFGHKNIVEKTQKDIDTVVKTILGEKRFKDSKLYLFSTTEFGSLNAVLYAENNAELVSAVSTFTLPANLYSLYKWNENRKNGYYHDINDTIFYATRFSLLLNSYGTENGNILKKFSLLENATAMSVPLLAASGKDDKSPLRKYIKKLSKKRKSNLEWLDIEDTENCMCSVESKSVLAKHTLDFFNKF